MVRGKTEMKRIEKARSRQVTFSKRRNGLLKKAFELSVLCDADVALIIFSATAKLYEFASSCSMQEIIQRYRKHVKDNGNPADESKQTSQDYFKSESEKLLRTIEQLEASKRKLLGEDVGPCSLEELEQIEEKLEKSVTTIRATKNHVYNEQIEKLKEKERILESKIAHMQSEDEVEAVAVAEQESNKDLGSRSERWNVETELFIGQPERGIMFGFI